MTERRITTRRPAGGDGMVNPARANMPTVPEDSWLRRPAR